MQSQKDVQLVPVGPGIFKIACGIFVGFWLTLFSVVFINLLLAATGQSKAQKMQDHLEQQLRQELAELQQLMNK